jgi:soluble lytic murein transglycosylase
MRPLLALFLAPALLVGCERAAAETRPGVANAAQPGVSAARANLAAAAAASRSKAAAPEGPWVQALRLGRYADAAAALDQVADLKAQPVLRYARARAALELGDAAMALTLLDGLESKLPALEARILRLRADAQLAVGPYAAAADFFAAKGDAESLARAALARERAGDLTGASVLAARVVAELKGKKRRATESAARDVRARASAKNGAKAQAISDLRWLALEDPLRSEDADMRLAALAPHRALTKEERLGRAHSFGRAGELERTLAEIEAIGKAPGTPIAPARLDRARAFAFYYARRDYPRAHELFLKAARGPGTDPAESLFYAARSLARGQDDEKAVRGYREVRARFPKSSYAEQAAYLIARTHYAAGRFADADKAYAAYLGGFGARARSRADAVYERAVTWLALGRHAEAANTFALLAKSENDTRRSARLRELEATARSGSGDKARAEQLFRDVARDQPLGFAALVSSARLAKLGVALPASIPASSAVQAPVDLAPVLPEAVTILRALGLERDAEAELIRAEASLKAGFGARAGEGLCRAYGLLGVAARRFQLAQTHVQARVLALEPTVSTRWQWDCVYPRPYADGVAEAAKQAGVPADLLYAVMRQESAFKPDVASHAGAHGLLQLLPTTAERLSAELGEPFDRKRLTEPATNLRLGAQYLRKLLRLFDGNVALAVASYNAGPVAVRRWLANAPTLPLDVFVARIPYGETQEYVERVIGNYARYRYLEGGESAVPQLTLELPPVPSDSEALY